MRSNITDHLGNIRSVLKDDGMGSYTLTGQYDYKPLDALLSQIGDKDIQTKTIAKVQN